ncbi:MAG: hypothetical protein H7246_16215, partial [Phycisphaerae bacterium]|nr:hypothetical protein [Saprospiraceae bacterium]
KIAMEGGRAVPVYKSMVNSPAYLNLKPFVVNAAGGTDWQKITDGWLYVNGEFLGAYTLPALVPVLAEGESEVILFPGIKENGIMDTPNIYPYLTKFTKKYNLTGGQTTEVQAVTDYDPGLTYAFGIGRGDFDGGSFIALENRDSDGVVNVELTTDGAFAGKSILMQVDTAHPIMDIATEKMVDLPTLGAPEVWLEMHYKTDIPFFLYLLSGTEERNEFVYLFNTSENWNKIYFNLTSNIIATEKSEQRLYFRLSLPKDNAGKYIQNSGKVLIDNIRVVHF